MIELVFTNACNVVLSTLHYESWPSAITNGKVNIFNYLLVKIIKKLALSDYIICVAKKFNFTIYKKQ